MSEPLQWVIACLGAYLAGSIPFGLLIGLARGIDIRTQGSGNIGATNLGRLLGKRWGALGLALDITKGALPVAMAGWWLGLLGQLSPSAAEAWGWMGIAACAVAGHMFSVFLRFKGGKGVATGLGVMLGLWPHVTVAGALAALVFIITIKITRYVSVSSCVAAASLPVWVVAWRAAVSMRNPDQVTLAGVWPFALGAALLACVVIFKHRANLARIKAGTEPKVGQKRNLTEQ